MPVGRSARKKLKQDRKRQKQNLILKKNIKQAINKFKNGPKDSLLIKVFSLLDTAKKKKFFHPNKVARLKSRLSKFLTKKTSLVTKKTSIPKKTSPRRQKKSV